MLRIIGISAFLVLMMILPSTAEASHNPYLYVSAENPRFNNHFAGSMVIEVVVTDPNLRLLDQGIGEPEVTVNGKKLRMVQASNGNWYAYFANKAKAQEADATVPAGSGQGLDFGVFCGSNTAASVLGVSFSNTEGVAIPSSTGLDGTSNGKSSFSACTGTPATPTLNNVVRNHPSLNQNPNVAVGQIGINAAIWPVVQLFSFSNDVTITYHRGGGIQQVKLHYNDIENISLILDRNAYPQNANVIATIYDMQLNQDPTSVDTWTFTAGSPQKTFYYAFTETGSNAANGVPGLVNIASKLSSLGFDKNGKLSLNLGPIAELITNQFQPSNSLLDGTTNIVTFVETEPNSGIFTNSDFQSKSNIKVSNSAPRGQSAVIEYNEHSQSIVSGTFTGSIEIGEKKAPSLQITTLIPGTKFAVTLVDSDQNLNSVLRDDLRIFNSKATVPAIKLGNPITLEKASDVQFFTDSSLTTSIPSITSTVDDTNSDILIIDTRSVSGTPNFESVSINLGITAQTLQDLLIDVNKPDTDGTNWINYDLRSFQQQLDVSNFSDMSMKLHFGSLDDAMPVTILDKGDVSSAQGLVQIDNGAVNSIKAKSGTVFLVINTAGQISSETDRQPIVFDIFSFGQRNSDSINNAIYRLELRETDVNSGVFAGTMEFAQSNRFDPSFIQSRVTIGSDIKFLVNERLLGEKGIILGYSDITSVGVAVDVSAQADIRTYSGKVTLNSQTFRFGHPVKIILTDPDLNKKHDTIDVYLTSNDPNSDNVDTVVDQNGNLLLEVLIKDVRYKRCTINGVETGGLASTGFTLIETGSATGIFEGTFKMPTRICNKDGTQLITPAGGSIDVRYHDARDSSGNPNIFGLTFAKSVSTSPVVEKIPDWIIISTRSWGDKKVDDNTFAIGVKYLINENLISPQTIDKSKLLIPSWVRNNAGWWTNGLITDNDYFRSIEYLIEKGIIKLP